MSKSRLVLISDTHLAHEMRGQKKMELPDGDILIHCGDAMIEGGHVELTEFNRWFSRFHHKSKIYVAGNHDKYMQQQNPIARQMLSPSITYLQDQSTEINGLKIYGSPWTPRFMEWHFQLDSPEHARSVWSLIPRDGVDILITHGPPYGILDLTYDGQHVGCQQLQKAVLDREPLLHAFGHVHRGYGVRKVGKTLFANSALLDEAYNVAHLPHVVDIDPVARTCEVVS